MVDLKEPFFTCVQSSSGPQTLPHGTLFQHKWPNSEILIPALELSYRAGQLVVPLKLFGKQTTLGNKNHTQLGTKEALGEEGTPAM